MSGYLLLRNNKQTGPYSLEELIKNGLKPYDLLWAEGKSAGWRYASELPELARYAPVIEEQPFDRFYKKTGPDRERERERERTEREREKEKERLQEKTSKEEQITPLADSLNEVMEQYPRRSRVVVMKPRKISITLPENAEIVSPPPSTVVAAKDASPALADSPVASLESKADAIRKRALEAARPAVADYSSILHPSDRLASKQESPMLRNEEIQRNTPFEPKTDQPVYRSRMSNAMVAAVAACLLLGGVVIGLAISNSRHSAEQEQLSQYVQQKIRERKESNPGNTPVTPAMQKPSSVSSESDPVQKDPSSENSQPAEHETTLGRQVAAHPKDEDPTGKKTAPVSTRVINTVQQENPSSISSEKKEPPTDIRQKEPVNTAAIETTRKKIYDLVSVEGSKYKIGVLGGISQLEITVSNNSLYPLDEVAVTINYHGPENRIVRTETIVVTDIGAGEQKMVPVPKSKRGVSVTYAVSRINSRVLGLAHSGL